MKHRWTWDFTGIPSLVQRKTLQVALDACDYPFKRIRRNTGRRVPVTVSDLSRYQASAHGAHAHVHGPEGETGHLLGDGGRRAALGLYWLPTASHPAGRVEIDQGCFNDPDLAREVFLAEAAHAVDYGVPLTDEQRHEIARALHGGGDPNHDDHGWFEERGEQNYWEWAGENFMGLFMAAFAPSLPRPMEARQPWVHANTPAAVARTRELLR